jgi:hypothetical protein
MLFRGQDTSGIWPTLLRIISLKESAHRSCASEPSRGKDLQPLRSFFKNNPVEV